MADLIDLHSNIRFGIEILKHENEKGEILQDVIICLRKKGYLPIVSPATSLIRCVAGRSSKTQYEYSRCLANLLNYLYFDARKIRKFQDISIEHIVDFLNFLKKEGHTRQDVLVHKQILTRIFYYTATHYTNICLIDSQDFQLSSEKKTAIIKWPTLDTQVLLPSAKTDSEARRNKLSNLDFDIVLSFLNIAADVVPNCALGFYFLFFGGIRGSEALHLTSEDIPSQYEPNAFFYITLSDKIINTESRYSDLNENKRPRRQMVICLSPLYNELYSKWKDMYHSGPIVRNRFGQAMTIQGFEYNFQRVKKILIEKLRNGNQDSKRLSVTLSSFSWGTHMGRAFFSNLVANSAKNPYFVPTARGDAGFDSALPYLADSDSTIELITSSLEKMYKEWLGDNVCV